MMMRDAGFFFRYRACLIIPLYVHLNYVPYIFYDAHVPFFGLG